jgi:hypothetical protein
MGAHAEEERGRMGAAGQARLPQLELGGVYLSETEIDELNRIVVMFLDFAEDQARRRAQIFLKDWQARLDDFLRFNDRAVLPDAGRVSREEANRAHPAAHAQTPLRATPQISAPASPHPNFFRHPLLHPLTA